MLTALSLGLRPRESGQLSTIIPLNHGITITYIYIVRAIRAIFVLITRKVGGA